MTITLFKVNTCMYDECGTPDQKELQGRHRILKIINEIYIFGESLGVPQNNNKFNY